MKTIEEALAEGYIIDHSAAGRPYAYKGARFGKGFPNSDHEGFSVLTELEAELLQAIDHVTDTLRGGEGFVTDLDWGYLDNLRDKARGLVITSTYTVIGFWPDSAQRFMESVEAEHGDAAEKLMAEKYPGLNIVGVVRGRHDAADTEIYIREGDSEAETPQDAYDNYLQGKKTEED